MPGVKSKMQSSQGMNHGGAQPGTQSGSARASQSTPISPLGNRKKRRFTQKEVASTPVSAGKSNNTSSTQSNQRFRRRSFSHPSSLNGSNTQGKQELNEQWKTVLFQRTDVRKMTDEEFFNLLQGLDSASFPLNAVENEVSFEIRMAFSWDGFILWNLGGQLWLILKQDSTKCDMKRVDVRTHS